ncbi:MAG: sigma-54-dependent Fis family transcriptional regulator [Candidatus Lambdaproteobacteria bacterium]|nr:sigma-54-dependent Fis family transcriptional regulator [Candidatus Lambdaproteobacteria bacterium]
MAFLNPRDREFMTSLSRFSYCNPFLLERVEHQRELLGRDFREPERHWTVDGPHRDPTRANRRKITERVESLLPKLRERLTKGVVPTDSEALLYQDAVFFLLYYRFDDRLTAAVVKAVDGQEGNTRFEYYSEFQREWDRFLLVRGARSLTEHQPAHLFACFFQICRAFRHVFYYIVGSSEPAARLRASVWESIFTHDMRRYRDVLYRRMGDMTTLVTGPTGTGKELVARAIGLSRFIAFDTKTMTFSDDFAGTFHALNLSALPSTLVESELFGHRRGAFTGALQDRQGWLEICGAGGTVFLDEIGDLDPSVQVKLLRVLQTRTFQRLGETKERRFEGKIIAATNRDVGRAMRGGQLREDFYYRLCSDVVNTPSLAERLRESPDELRELLTYILRRTVGDGAEDLVANVESWIVNRLGPGYDWPGNIRELEQCVRSVLIHREYRPPRAPALPALEEFRNGIHDGTLTADELMRRYCTLMYFRTGSYEEAARRLGMDRRTVKSRIDKHLLDELRLAQ